MEDPGDSELRSLQDEKTRYSSLLGSFLDDSGWSVTDYPLLESELVNQGFFFPLYL